MSNAQEVTVMNALDRAANHAAEVQVQLQEEGKQYKPVKHFKVDRGEFIALHRSGLLSRTNAVGWYCLRDMPVWLE